MSAEVVQEVDPLGLVIAVFHKVGEEAWIKTWPNLHRLFNEAAELHPKLMGCFQRHPTYDDSQTLRKVLQKLRLGGSIEYRGVQVYFCIARRVVGGYGKRKYDMFSTEQQKIIDELAENIRTAFLPATSPPVVEVSDGIIPGSEMDHLGPANP